MPQISERLIAVCDELNFPLIKMPIHVSYYEVLTAIIDKLLAHKVHTLEGIIQVYEAFNTQLMNIEEDYSSLLAMLGNMIGAPLAFFNHNQKCIYSSWGRESDALLKEIFCQSRSLFSNLSDIPKTPVPLTVAGKQYLVRPVHSNNTYYGVLIIETSEYPLTGLMNFYIKQTCQALCIILLNSERQDKYRKRLRYEYLYDLLLGNLGDRMQILSQGRSLDYQIAGVDRVLVVSPAGSEQSSGFQPLQRLEAQIPHVFPSSIPIIMTEPLELVLLSTGKKPKDLAYMGRWISALLLSENMESLVGVSSSCGGPEKSPPAIRRPSRPSAFPGSSFPSPPCPMYSMTTSKSSPCCRAASSEKRRRRCTWTRSPRSSAGFSWRRPAASSWWTPGPTPSSGTGTAP